MGEIILNQKMIQLQQKKVVGACHNCNILGDIILPKNQINKWKIKLSKYSQSLYAWNIIIGVIPSNINQNESSLYNKS